MSGPLQRDAEGAFHVIKYGNTGKVQLVRLSEIRSPRIPAHLRVDEPTLYHIVIYIQIPMYLYRDKTSTEGEQK